MKRLRFLGDSLICLREFPEDARHDAGRHWCISCGLHGRLADAVYVLHAFQKKTQATAKRDLELANKRFTELMRGAQ